MPHRSHREWSSWRAYLTRRPAHHSPAARARVAGTGTGVGSGRGPGMGPGSGGGTGGGVYRIGGGVTPPEVVTQAKPTYTAEALRAKIQGSVLLEVIVQRDGTPGRVQVVRSLDAGGLDVRAIEAVREWRFKPGRLGDTPVDVLVTIIMDFSVR